MKTAIHPTFYPEAQATCACGNTLVVGSTVESITTEICSNCHPFFTGKQKLIDTAGTVDRFKKRTALAEKAKAVKTEKKARKPRATKA